MMQRLNLLSAVGPILNLSIRLSATKGFCSAGGHEGWRLSLMLAYT